MAALQVVTQAASLANLSDLEAAIAAAQHEKIDTADAVQALHSLYGERQRADEASARLDASVAAACSGTTTLTAAIRLLESAIELALAQGVNAATAQGKLGDTPAQHILSIYLFCTQSTLLSPSHPLTPLSPPPKPTPLTLPPPLTPSHPTCTHQVNCASATTASGGPSPR